MRSAIALLLAPLLVACGGAGKPCSDADLVCGNDGRLYCRVLPLHVTEIARACCEYGKDAASIEKGDTGPAAPTDGAVVPPDASAPVAVDAGQPGADAAEEHGGRCIDDAGMLAMLYASDGGLFHPGRRDDAGIPSIYNCFQDICHPFPFAYDGGIPGFFLQDGGSSQCGPVGCQ